MSKASITTNQILIFDGVNQSLDDKVSNVVAPEVFKASLKGEQTKWLA